jgi:hypothetical protein
MAKPSCPKDFRRVSQPALHLRQCNSSTLFPACRREIRRAKQCRPRGLLWRVSQPAMHPRQCNSVPADLSKTTLRCAICIRVLQARTIFHHGNCLYFYYNHFKMNNHTTRPRRVCRRRPCAVENKHNYKSMQKLSAFVQPTIPRAVFMLTGSQGERGVKNLI